MRVLNHNTLGLGNVVNIYIEFSIQVMARNMAEICD